MATAAPLVLPLPPAPPAPPAPLAQARDVVNACLAYTPEAKLVADALALLEAQRAVSDTAAANLTALDVNIMVTQRVGVRVQDAAVEFLQRLLEHVRLSYERLTRVRMPRCTDATYLIYAVTALTALMSVNRHDQKGRAVLQTPEARETIVHMLCDSLMHNCSITFLARPVVQLINAVGQECKTINEVRHLQSLQAVLPCMLRMMHVVDDELSRMLVVTMNCVFTPQQNTEKLRYISTLLTTLQSEEERAKLLHKTFENRAFNTDPVFYSLVAQCFSRAPADLLNGTVMMQLASLTQRALQMMMQNLETANFRCIYAIASSSQVPDVLAQYVATMLDTIALFNKVQRERERERKRQALMAEQQAEQQHITQEEEQLQQHIMQTQERLQHRKRRVQELSQQRIALESDEIMQSQGLLPKVSVGTESA